MPLFRKEIIVVITAVVTFAFLSILESFSYFQTDGNISDLKFLEVCFSWDCRGFLYSSESFSMFRIVP